MPAKCRAEYTMNSYLCYDSESRAYLMSAYSVDDVIHRIEKQFHTHVSCWFIVDGGFKLPRGLIVLG